MSRRQVRGSQQIRKPRGRRAENTKILIVAEGSKTEPQYFEGLAAHLNAQAVSVLSVKPIGLGQDPLRVVQEAGRRDRDERRDGDPYDAIWCVVDVDDHATLPDACELARQKGFDTAVSCPCFEIWLLWHFQDHTAWAKAEDLAAKLKRHGFTDKNLPRNFPYSKFDTARQRAGKCAVIETQHRPPNPSSSVARLIDALEIASGSKRNI